MTTGPADDLARIADLLGLQVSPADLAREAPQIRALLADQDKLRALPLEDRAPAFTPRLFSAPAGSE
jgi:hypothetical protein